MLDPPLPLSAVFNPPLGPVTVTFSHPILSNPALDPSNWFVRRSNNSFTFSLLKAVGGVVELTTLSPTINPGPDVVSYSPPPFDVLSDTARAVPAPAFADFPLT